MNWLFLIVLIVVVLSAAAGYHRGLVRTALSMVFLILVMFLAGWISPFISDALTDHTRIAATIHNACTEMLENTLSSQSQTETGVNAQEQENILESLGLPAGLLDSITIDENIENTQRPQKELFVEAAADELTGFAVDGIVFIVSFLLAWIIVRILMRVADMFAELPVIGFVNRVCGGLVGLLRGFLWVWLFFIILTIFVGTVWGRVCMQAVSENTFLQLLYDNNLILNLILYFFH